MVVTRTEIKAGGPGRGVHLSVVSPGLQPCLEWPPLLAPPARPPPSFLQTSWEPDAVASWEMPADTKASWRTGRECFLQGPGPPTAGQGVSYQGPALSTQDSAGRAGVGLS